MLKKLQVSTTIFIIFKKRLCLHKWRIDTGFLFPAIALLLVSRGERALKMECLAEITSVYDVIVSCLSLLVVAFIAWLLLRQ